MSSIKNIKLNNAIYLLLYMQLIENAEKILIDIINKKEMLVRTLFVMLAQDSKNSFTIRGIDFNISDIIKLKGGSFTITTSTRKLGAETLKTEKTKRKKDNSKENLYYE